jgi:hypothetical protein
LGRGDEELASWFRQPRAIEAVEAECADIAKVSLGKRDLWTAAVLVFLQVAWMTALLVGAVFVIRLA